MPKGSEELTNARKEEIVDACASLYEEKSFREITIRDIGERTSFTRTSIYNYFQTKEEIFLALLQREHEAWAEDLRRICSSNDAFTAKGFAEAIAETLEKRRCMLKLMCMNLYDMEDNSRIGNLAAFKRKYAETLDAIAGCLRKFFPSMNEKDIDDFIYAFFPFLFGLYPYTTTTEKQREAMIAAGVRIPHCTVKELAASFTAKMLKAF